MFVGQKPGSSTLKASGVKEVMCRLVVIEAPPAFTVEPAVPGPLALPHQLPAAEIAPTCVDDEVRIIVAPALAKIASAADAALYPDPRVTFEAPGIEKVTVVYDLEAKVSTLDRILQEPLKGAARLEMVTVSPTTREFNPVRTVATSLLILALEIWVAVQAMPIPGLGEPGLFAELETELLVIDETAALLDPVIAMAGQRSR
jgi:hypothetical protein